MHHQYPKLPPLLEVGATIAVVAPAGIVNRPKLEASMAYLQQLGFRTKTYRDIYADVHIFAGDDSARAAELMSAFEDEEVQAIFAARGGYGCIRLLNLLDFSLIANHPKIFLGYSDNTVLHAALTQKCNLVAYHGPHASDFRSPNGGMSVLSEAALWQTLLKGGVESLVGRLSNEIVKAAEEPNGLCKSLRSVVPGAARGPVVGGNLALVCALLGTDFQIETADKLLFLEDVDEPPYRIDRFLQQLRLAGALDQVSGVILGGFTRCEDPTSNWTTSSVLLEFFGDATFPVMTDFPAGHGDVNLTLALGLDTFVDPVAKRLVVTRDE